MYPRTQECATRVGHAVETRGVVRCSADVSLDLARGADTTLHALVVDYIRAVGAPAGTAATCQMDTTAPVSLDDTYNLNVLLCAWA